MTSIPTNEPTMIALWLAFYRESNMHALAAEKEGHVSPWRALDAPLASDAVLHGPLFTKPLVGAAKIKAFYDANHAIAGPLDLRFSLTQGSDCLLLARQVIDKREISAGLWLRRDASGAVTEISHGLSPFPRLQPYHDAMKERLIGLVPDTHWALDDAARVTSVVGEEGFPPFQFDDEAQFHSPLVDKPLQGVDRVRQALAEASIVYGTRRYLVRCKRPDVFGSVWEAAVNGHIIRCVSLFFMSPTGAIKDIVACMLPYPALALVYNGVKERNKEKLGTTYFSV